MLNAIHKYYVLLKIVRIMLWSRYWATRSKDPIKRKLCMILFSTAKFCYDMEKPNIWPSVSEPNEFREVSHKIDA